MKRCFLPLTIMLLSGCSLFAKPSTYIPPVVKADTAKFRVAGYPTTVFNVEKNGEGIKEGGGVLEKNGVLNLMRHVPKEIGMPKVTGKVYAENEYEVAVLPGKETRVTHSTLQCTASILFIPQAKGLYEFYYTYNQGEACALYGNEIIFDTVNNVYVEREIDQI